MVFFIVLLASTCFYHFAVSITALSLSGAFSLGVELAASSKGCSWADMSSLAASSQCDVAPSSANTSVQRLEMSIPVC